jgi:calcium-dependent protein kinase
MGNCCRSKQKDGALDLSNNQIVQQISDIKFDKSNFLMQRNEKFTEHYLIGQSLGTGAYGEVRKCRNIKTKQNRAVKILRKDRMDDFETKRLTNEIQLLRQVTHPNILKMYEFYEDEKRYYLVTELCSGGELYDEILVRG